MEDLAIKADAGGQKHPNFFFEISVKVCRFDVGLCEFKVVVCSKGNDESERVVLCHWCESFIIVNSGKLGKALCA